MATNGQPRRKLTYKQQRFVVEYLVDLNATQAAIRSGYAKGTANREGSRLLSNVDIQTAIEVSMADRSDRVEVDADYVVTELRNVVEADSTPAAARVTALTVLARHLGMLTDKLETKELTPTVKIINLPAPGFEDFVRDDSKPNSPSTTD